MSKYDDRRKQLGLVVAASPNSTSTGSKYDRRRQEIAAEREAERQASIARAQQEEEQQAKAKQAAVKQQMSKLGIDPWTTTKGVMTSRDFGTNFLNQEAAKANEKLKAEQEHKQKYDQLPKWRQVIVDVMNSKAGKKATKANDISSDFLRGATDTASFGATHLLDKVLLNNLPEQERQREQEKINRANSSAAGKAGKIAGYFVPGAAEDRAAAAGVNLVMKNAPKVVRAITRGGLAGAIDTTGQELGDVAFRNESFDPLNIAIGTALGGTAGGAFYGASKGLQAGVNSVRKTMEDVTRNQLKAIMDATAKSYPQRINVPGAQEQLDKVMADIHPIVTERVTPPLENENELAKWVRENVDPNMSLNEVRKLSYNDLADMATEITKQPGFVYNQAVKAAQERGYDLPALLEGKGSSIRQQAAQDASRRAYGVYPDELPNVRRNITDSAVPEVIEESAPANVNWFQRLFGNRGVGIVAGGGATKSGTQAQIVNNAIKADKEGAIDAIKTGARNLYQTHVDALSPIKRTFGQESYDTAMDANRASNIANTIVHDKFVDMEGNVLGKSMSEIFKQIPRGLDNEAIDYLVLRDAKARVLRNEKVYEDRLNMNDANKIEDRIKKYEAEHPVLVNFGKEWDQFTKNIRQVYGLDSGLLNAEQVAAMEAARPNYTPMRRQFKMSERIKHSFAKSNTGFSGQKAPIQNVSPTGSVRKIVDPRRTMMESTQKWVQNAMNNRVMQQIGDAVMENPEGLKDIAEIVRTPTKTANKMARAYADEEKLAEAIKNGNEDEFLEDLSNQFRKLFDKSKSGDDTVLTYMKNGQPIAIRIKDPEAIRALVSLGPQQVGPIVKILGYFSKLTKQSATGLLAPFFAVRQLTVDLPSALIQAKNPMTHLADYGHALVSSVVEAIPGLKETGLARLATDFKRTGGGYSSIMRSERGINKGFRSMKRDPYLSAGGIRQGVTTAVKAPFKVLEKIGDVSENLNRMAAYKGELRRGGNVRTPENVRNAINASREITVNFSRKGTNSAEMESLIPYNNAAVQGIRRVAVAFKDHPLKTSAGVVALAIIPKMVEYSMFANDPDYQNIPARDRYRKLFVHKNPDGTFVSVQMPPEYNALGALTEDIMRKYIGNDPQAMKGVADALMNAYTPPAVAGVSQGLTQGGGVDQSILGALNAMSPGAIVGASVNQSYTGSPIVPKSMQELSPQYQYDERTSAVAKSLGEKLNWSPKKIDYLLRQYSGDIGRYVLPLTSTKGSSETKKTILRNFITDPVYTNTLSDDYYRAKDLVTRVEADNKAVGAELPSWYSDKIHKLMTSTAKGSVGAQLRSLNNQKKAIDADNKMPNYEKANKLKDIQVQINSLYTDILSQLEEAGVPIKGR